MKKLVLLLATGILCVAMTACGKEADDAANVGTGSVENISESSESRDDNASQTESGTTVEEEQNASSEPSEENQQNKYQVGNIDNFSVNSNMVAAFARDVKAAVADKDLEALADLAAFPLYMGLTEGGVSVDTREDFIAMGEDSVFTQELVDAIAAADESNLSASRAGFSLTDTGVPNIVFGVRDGRLAIQGINY